MTGSSATGLVLTLITAVGAVAPGFAAESEDHRLFYLGAPRDVQAATDLEIALDTAIMAHLGGRRGLVALGPAEAFLMAGSASSAPITTCQTPALCRQVVDRLAPELGRINTFLRSGLTEPSPGRIVLVLEHGSAQADTWVRKTSVEMPAGVSFLQSFARDLLDDVFDLDQTAPRRVLKARNLPDGARIWIPCLSMTGKLPDQAERLVGDLLATQLSVYDNIADVRPHRGQCCDTSRCKVDRAVREGADHLILAKLEQSEEGAPTRLTLKLMEVTGLRIVNQVVESYIGPASELPAAIQYAASRLVGYQMEGQGRLHIVSTVDRATLFVSEDIVPFQGDATLIRSAQRYPLRLTAEGYEDVERDAFVLEGRLREVYLDPVPQASSSILTNWWFWTAIGVGVIGVGAGMAVALQPDSGPVTFSVGN